MRALTVASAASLILAVGARAQDMDPAQAEKVQAGVAADAESARQAGLPLPESTKAEGAAAAAVVAKSRQDRWGLAVDAGVPEGISVGLLYRPLQAVRIWAGPAWNYVGWGGQIGVAAVPWHFVVTPVVSAEVGHYFHADASFLASNSKGIPEQMKPLLSKMSYSYAAAHVGIELGSQRSLSLFVRAGISYLMLSTDGTVTTTDATSGATVTITDVKVKGTVPSAKVGIQYWF